MPLKIQYTSWAKTSLKSFHEEITRKIEEEIIKERKFPWADIIEINTSDIKEYASRIQIKKSRNSNYNLYLIAFLGPTIYNEVKIALITKDALVMLIWVTFFFIWISTYIFVKLKEKQHKNERDMLTFEEINQKMLAEFIVKMEEIERVKTSK